MTDARLPGRWLTDPNLEALSDRLWRVHTGALMWAAEQGTDGLIPRRTLRLLHPEIATPDDAAMLVAAALWAVDGDDFLVLDWERSQSLSAVIEHQRERNRQKQRAHRARSNADVTGYVTGHVPGESLRQGQDRLGEASSSSKVSTSGTGQVADHDIDDVSAIENSDAPSVVVVDTDSVFERVWVLWPKKTSKKVAAAKFALVARRHPRGLHGLADEIAAHARAYEQHGHPPQFVPMLSTWLNGERWNDPLPGPRGAASAVDQNASVLSRYASPEGDER